MTSIGAHACRRCGACCHATDTRYIRLFGVDEERLDEDALALTWHDQQGRFMRFVASSAGSADGSPPHRRCIALRFAAGRPTCAIHPARPDACRWLRPGSSHCKQLQTAAGIPLA